MPYMIHELKLSYEAPNTHAIPDSKIDGANVGLTWVRQDPGGPHVGHANLAIWDIMKINEML